MACGAFRRRASRHRRRERARAGPAERVSRRVGIDPVLVGDTVAIGDDEDQGR
jgi:hypothetical protein